MIKINLLPEVKRRAPKKAAAAKAPLQIPFTWIIAGLLAVVLAGAASMMFHLRMVEKLNERQKRIAAMQEEIKKYKVQQGLVEKARQQRNALAQKLEVISTLKQRQTGPVRLLEELAGAIPPRLWLTMMAESGGSLSLNGSAIDHRVVAQFMENLAKRPIFSGVELLSSVGAASAGGLATKNFALTCRVNPIKEKPKE